ncbi:MAG: ATP-dependent helicase [Lachnospiraceae bacterium]|nr:ATP-dependent helicase [Lachnospiraceae bacterium]
MKIDLSRFNDAQREAICHDTGPALVLAGPGSGKTAVLTQRLLYLVRERGIPPESILVVTFTKAAALEMQQRFAALANEKLPVTFGTFHSVFFQILRETSSQSSLTVLTQKEKRELLVRCLRKKEISANLQDAFLKEIEGIKCMHMLPADYMSHIPGITKEQIFDVMHMLEEMCRIRGKLDFDDMAYLCDKLLTKRPEILSYYQERFRYILIDEYQDINEIQAHIMDLLAGESRNLFMVGDDDQSIYRFRGASSRNMLRLPKRYPNLHKIILSVNYRCHEAIIRAASSVISENKLRFVKKQTAAMRDHAPSRDAVSIVICKSRSEEKIRLRDLLKTIVLDQGITSVAILFRRRKDADDVAALFQECSISLPSFSKKNDAESSFREDLHAYLRLIDGNGTLDDLIRVMNKPEREIDREDLPTCKDLSDAKGNCRKLLEQLKVRRGGDLFSKIMYIRKVLAYDSYLKEAAPGLSFDQIFRDDVMDLHQKESACDTGKFCLETYHGSKGLEYDAVILPDVIEGIVPNRQVKTQDELEEERRMLYVAMTRAKKHLYIFSVDNKKTDEKPSVFLKPLFFFVN